MFFVEGYDKDNDAYEVYYETEDFEKAKEIAIVLDKIAKTDKQTYSPNDWEKATKYTDDTAWKNWTSDTGDFGKYKKDIQTQLDGKSETTYGGSTPPSNPETGDLWFCTDGSNGYGKDKAYMYDGATWKESNGVPDSVWDKMEKQSVNGFVKKAICL